MEAQSLDEEQELQKEAKALETMVDLLGGKKRDS
jgi:hypothetical protein